MTIFTTKDWSVAKTIKIRDGVQKKLGLAAPATDVEISNHLDDVLRREVRTKVFDDNFATAATAHAAALAANAGYTDI